MANDFLENSGGGSDYCATTDGGSRQTLGWTMPESVRQLLEVNGMHQAVDLGPVLPHAEVVAELARVRSELSPLFEMQANCVPKVGKINFTGYNWISGQIAQFRHELLSAYSHDSLSGVLSLVVLEHPSDLNTVLNPAQQGTREKPAVFTHVDFKDPRHQILGPDGFAARVVRDFQSTFNPPALVEPFAQPSPQEGA